MKRLSWFVFFSIITISCLDQPDCYQLNNNLAVVAFKIIGGGNDAYIIKEISTAGPDGEIVVNDSLEGTAALQLPLNPYGKEISFAFDAAFGPFASPAVKTLDIAYKTQIQFVSEDCGERYFFSDMAVVSTDFDSVRILNAVPTQPPSSNFEIYRCPITDAIHLAFPVEQAISTITLLPDDVLNVNETTTTILLPINLNAKVTDYLFRFQDGTESRLSVTYRTTPRTLVSRCGEQVFVDSLGYDAEKTDFAVTVKADSIYDLPTEVNFELAR